MFVVVTVLSADYVVPLFACRISLLLSSVHRIQMAETNENWTRAALRLAFEARFSNDFSSDVGVEVIYILDHKHNTQPFIFPYSKWYLFLIIPIIYLTCIIEIFHSLLIWCHVVLTKNTHTNSDVKTVI